MNTIIITSPPPRRSSPISSPTTATENGRRVIRPRTVSTSVEEVMTTEDLIRKILTTLKAKEMFRCTLLSKQWNDIITSSTLISEWKHHPTTPIALYVRRHTQGNNVRLHRIPLLKRDSKKPTICKLDFVQNRSDIKINQSCNGLLICSSSASCVDSYAQMFYVYNPTTKRYLPIPRPTPSEKLVVSMNLAFTSLWDYKVVAVISYQPLVAHHIEIYEARKSLFWRNPELMIPMENGGRTGVCYENGVCANGAVYWSCYKHGGLMFFKIRGEKIVWLPNVPSKYVGDLLFFGEYGGRLRMVRSGSLRDSKIAFLELEADHSAWYVKYSIDFGSRFSYVSFHVLAVVSAVEGGGGDDNECVVLSACHQVILYSVKRERVRKICDLRLRMCDAFALARQRWFHVHPLLETFLRP